ncbi:pectinesterase inhibitor 9-like [Phalaenopsis equestris]|uniref:pectinesterase inhibitor 9-like n=1 Tax=Phalaenopsis equestris TaxID=78828 RepID=UPI0009E42319|nr:pectinesterase inhibitor 9-like [Phalaenopsis equestris]
MEKHRSPILTLAAAAAAISIALSFNTTAAAPIDFIRSSCNVTRYPDLCEKCLIGYTPAIRHRSPRQLAHAALKVSADRAFAASNFVHKMSVGSKSSSTARRTRDGGAVRDCVETIDDSVDRLRRSVKEMERMGRHGSISFGWHLSNVQTWVSAALTDQSTCLDSLSQDKSAANVRPEIRRHVVHVSRLTSNALALINRLDPNN